MKIAIGCDHGGYPLTDLIVETITNLGHEVLSLDTCSAEPVDYVDIAVEVARAVAAGRADLGILYCGTGIGMSLAANKIKGVFAARAEDSYSARMAREHNGANVLALGGRTVGPELARETVAAFLQAQPSPEARHARRREKLRALENDAP